ncbi:MAG: hypothetical protein ACREB5_02570, partial [Sphingomonadaceae bacterium]
RDEHRGNVPEALARTLAPHRAAGFFGELPYGSDLTAEEIALGRALRRLQARAQTMGGRIAIALGLARPLSRDRSLTPLLARMGLAAPRGLRERFWRRLVAAALAAL